MEVTAFLRKFGVKSPTSEHVIEGAEVSGGRGGSGSSILSIMGDARLWGHQPLKTKSEQGAVTVMPVLTWGTCSEIYNFVLFIKVF